MQLISATAEARRVGVTRRTVIKVNVYFRCPQCGRVVTPSKGLTQFEKTNWCRHDRWKMHQSHGLSRHSIYKIWSAMKQRCTNPKAKKWENYGGRGIKICKKWENSSANFMDWALSHGWKPGLDLDRRNNNGNYCPSNCRFVTHARNNQNKITTKLNPNKVRDIRRRSAIGESARVLAEEFGVTRQLIYEVRSGKKWKNIK